MTLARIVTAAATALIAFVILTSTLLLAKNTLDDGFDASPALVDSEIYLRGYKYLYAIAQP